MDWSNHRNPFNLGQEVRELGNWRELKFRLMVDFHPQNLFLDLISSSTLLIEAWRLIQLTLGFDTFNLGWVDFGSRWGFSRLSLSKSASPRQVLDLRASSAQPLSRDRSRTPRAALAEDLRAEWIQTAWSLRGAGALGHTRRLCGSLAPAARLVLTPGEVTSEQEETGRRRAASPLKFCPVRIQKRSWDGGRGGNTLREKKSSVISSSKSTLSALWWIRADRLKTTITGN